MTETTEPDFEIVIEAATSSAAVSLPAAQATAAAGQAVAARDMAEDYRDETAAMLAGLLVAEGKLPHVPFPEQIAHRGWENEAPENTMTAFLQAAINGAPSIEFDINKSSDGHYPIIHDDWVDRTTDGTGLVYEKTLAELRALDASAQFASPPAGKPRIPVFEEVVAFAAQRGLFMYPEFKGPTLDNTDIANCVDIVRAYGMEERTIFYSFNFAQLVTVRGLSPKVGVMYSQISTFNYINELAALGGRRFMLLWWTNYRDNQTRAADCRAVGVEPMAATIETRAQLKLMRDRGVNLIMTRRRFPEETV